ncbi:MAG: papain-like cysteine protease family protein [Promethearchaeati archaeon]
MPCGNQGGFHYNKDEEGTPVIAYLDKEIGDAQMRHAVVVTGFSSDKTEIRYNDPITSEPQTVATSRFLEEWEKVYRYHVKLEISEDFDMTDFLGDE